MERHSWVCKWSQPCIFSQGAETLAGINNPFTTTGRHLKLRLK